MPVAWTIETHDSVSSTQDLVRAQAHQKEGLVIQAATQSQGRGRHGRNWVSEPGNLYLSFLLKPDCPARLIGQLSLLTGAALGQSIRDVLKNPDQLMLKWPNDVLLGGQKCAGILIETNLSSQNIEAAIIGVGVNLKSAPEIGTALEGHLKAGMDVNMFRDLFLQNIAELYNLWQNGRFSDIRDKWLKMAHKSGSAVGVKLGDQLIEGFFDGIDEQGNLLLNQSGQQKKVTAGEVYLINSSS